MDITIVIGYQLFAKRLLESEVIFGLMDGQMRTEEGLSRRPKTQPSTIDWHHTRKVLMHSYGESEGFTAKDMKSSGHKDGKDDVTANTEKDQVSEHSDFEAERSSDEEMPGLKQRQDEIKAFLDGFNDSDTAGRFKAEAPQVSVQKAITAIMKEIRDLIPKGGGVFDPMGNGVQDVETGHGSLEDRRQTLYFEKTGTQMLRLFFESLKFRTGKEILEWFVQNRDGVPKTCHRVYRVGSNWFRLDLLKAGKWPEMGRVTFDEAHIIRNLDSTFYIAARLIPARELLLVTGTPQFNGTQDILAYANVFAARSGLDQYFHSLSGECPSVSQHIRTSEDIITKGWVQLRDNDPCPFIEALHKWANKDLPRRQWWCLLRQYRAAIGWKKRR